MKTTTKGKQRDLNKYLRRGRSGSGRSPTRRRPRTLATPMCCCWKKKGDSNMREEGKMLNKDRILFKQSAEGKIDATATNNDLCVLVKNDLQQDNTHNN